MDIADATDRCKGKYCREELVAVFGRVTVLRKKNTGFERRFIGRDKR